MWGRGRVRSDRGNVNRSRLLNLRLYLLRRVSRRKNSLLVGNSGLIIRNLVGHYLLALRWLNLVLLVWHLVGR